MADPVRLWKTYDRGVEWLTRWAARLGGLLILAVGFFVFYEVICRYVFDSPTLWVMDFSIYFIMWAVLLGAAYNMRTKGHVLVDVVVKKLSAGSNRWIGFIIHVLIFVFSLILTMAGVKSCLSAVRMNELTMSALYIPLVYPLSSLPVGFFLLTLEEFRAASGVFLATEDTELGDA